MLIENGLKVLCPSYHRYTSQFIATSLAPPHAPPLPIALNDVAEELEDNRNKGDEGRYKWQRTKQAKRKERQNVKLTVLDATSSECE